MYLIPVEVRKSQIDGDGVFTTTDIKQGTVVWQFTDGHDKKMTKEEFEALDESTRTALGHTAYISPTTDMWVMPPEDDPACYTNHDPNSHNMSVVFDRSMSDEPLFTANRDIKSGEELTNNYLDFDNNSTPEKFDWLSS